MLPSGRRVALWIAVLVCSQAAVVSGDEPVAPAPVVETTPAPTVVVEPAPVAQPAVVVQPAAPERKDDVPRPSYKLCIGLGAGAIAALVTGGVLGGIAHSREADQNGNVNSPSLYSQALIDQGKQAESIAIAGYVFLGIGGALAIADVVLWVERLRKPPKKKVEAAATRSLSQAPKISIQASGLQVTF